ncbi:MAG: transposase family protein [Myxococcales bacterium]|nr:transposase family protein [Myxococcales bacterium]
MTPGTIKTDDKSHEITAIPDLIRTLNLKGATVTGVLALSAANEP